MKNLSMIVWLTQLGFSIAFPLAGFILLAVWLRERFSLGPWVLVAGIVLGFAGAVDGLRHSLKVMELLSKNSQKDEEPPPVAFNSHD